MPERPLPLTDADSPADRLAHGQTSASQPWL